MGPLVRAATTVVLHPDGDRAGERAVARVQAYVQAKGRTCRIRRCTAGLDPAEEVTVWMRAR